LDIRKIRIGARKRPPHLPQRVHPVEGAQVQWQLVPGELHPREIHAQGARGAQPAQGHHGPAEDGAEVVRHGLGRCSQVHLLGLLYQRG